MEGNEIGGLGTLRGTHVWIGFLKLHMPKKRYIQLLSVLELRFATSRFTELLSLVCCCVNRANVEGGIYEQ
jgi:hypothetical protein